VAGRRWTEEVAVRARAALAWEPRGHPPSNVVRPDKPYDVAARRRALQKPQVCAGPRGGQLQGQPPKCCRRCLGR
jgi:hypothetical protein